MPVYQHIAAYDAAVEDVWAWYDSPGPSVDHARVGRHPSDTSRRPGERGQDEVPCSTRPLRPMWVARHYDVVPGEVFNDVMEKGRSGLGIMSTASCQREVDQRNPRHDSLETALSPADLLDSTLHGEGAHEADVCLPHASGARRPETHCYVR